MSRDSVMNALTETLTHAAWFGPEGRGTVVQHDYRVLATGLDYAVIVLDGPWQQRRLTVGANVIDWRFALELYVRHDNDLVRAADQAGSCAQALVERINADQTLGGVVIDSMIEEGRPERDLFVVGEKPYYKETLTVRCTEDLTYA